jgi:transposase
LLIRVVRKGQQLPWIVSDELWARILFVLYTGIRWEFLPQELGFGSGMTCWRRLRDWNDAGVWTRLHENLLAELHADPGHPASTRSPRAPATTAGHGVCRPCLRPRQVSRVITAMQPSSCGRAAAIPPPPTSTRPVDPDVVPTHGDVIVSEGSGDEVLRGEDVAAHKPASTTMRQGIDARLATLTTLAKAG